MNHKEVTVEYYDGTVDCNGLWTIVWWNNRLLWQKRKHCSVIKEQQSTVKRENNFDGEINNCDKGQDNEVYLWESGLL